MNKETLARAKELEKDIQQMESALSYYKQGKWSNWDWQNDRACSFHFEFCKNWDRESFNRQDLPTWLNKPLMEVVERELERRKHVLEALTDDSTEIITDVLEPDLSMAAMAASFELDKPRKASWKDNAVRTIGRLISWMIYSMTFCFLFGVAGLDLSVREIIAYSLMLGLVIGSINNIERVMRELFKKED